MQVANAMDQEWAVAKREKFEYIGKLCGDQHTKIKLVHFSPPECSIELCLALTGSNSVIAW